MNWNEKIFIPSLIFFLLWELTYVMADVPANANIQLPFQYIYRFCFCKFISNRACVIMIVTHSFTNNAMWVEVLRKHDASFSAVLFLFDLYLLLLFYLIFIVLLVLLVLILFLFHFLLITLTTVGIRGQRRREPAVLLEVDAELAEAAAGDLDAFLAEQLGLGADGGRVVARGDDALGVDDALPGDRLVVPAVVGVVGKVLEAYADLPGSLGWRSGDMSVSECEERLHLSAKVGM